MALLKRDAVYQALFDLVTADPGVRANFVEFGRFLPQIEQWDGSAGPGLFTFQFPEKRVYKGKGMEPIRTLNVGYFAYFSMASMVTAIPATAINAALDALDTVISFPGNPANVQTLGGQVEHVYIEPDVRPFEGLLQDRSLFVATVAILIP